MTSFHVDRRAATSVVALARGQARPSGAVAALVLAVLGGVLGAATTASASAPPAVELGTRVRVWVPGAAVDPVVGTVRALDAQTLTVDVRGRPEPVEIPRERIQRLDVSLGRHSRLRGALIGALAGAGIGALIGKAAHTNRPFDFESVDEAAGALGGLLLGTGIGALVPPGDRWQHVEAVPSRVSLAPRAGRAPGIAFAIAF